MAERQMLLDSNLDSVEVAEAAVLKDAVDIGFEEEQLHQIGKCIYPSPRRPTG
jgi:hypothetical protein